MSNLGCSKKKFYDQKPLFEALEKTNTNKDKNVKDNAGKTALEYVPSDASKELLDALK